MKRFTHYGKANIIVDDPEYADTYELHVAVFANYASRLVDFEHFQAEISIDHETTELFVTVTRTYENETARIHDAEFIEGCMSMNEAKKLAESHVEWYLTHRTIRPWKA